MFIFIVFVSAGVSFCGAFSLWVILKSTKTSFWLQNPNLGSFHLHTVKKIYSLKNKETESIYTRLRTRSNIVKNIHDVHNNFRHDSKRIPSVKSSLQLKSSFSFPMREKFPNAKYFLVRIFPYLDWIWRFKE